MNPVCRAHEAIDFTGGEDGSQTGRACQLQCRQAYQHTGDAPLQFVEALLIAPEAAAPPTRVREARALRGRGLAGDRYAELRGTFRGRWGYDLTLVEANQTGTKVTLKVPRPQQLGRLPAIAEALERELVDMNR